MAIASKEKLVVEVVAAHNLMPKDGEGSSSPFVEVEFENQRLKTQVKYKDFNPIWNQKLVFHIKDVADLSYRTIEVNVFNERRSSNNRNFLGKVRVSGSSVAKQGEEVVQLHTLDKRSLFSHIRGEISLKPYVSTREEVKEVGGFGNGEVVSSTPGSSNTSKKNRKIQQKNPVILQQPQQMSQEVINNSKQAKEQGQNNINANLAETNPAEIKPVVITTALGPGSLVSGSGEGIVGPAGGAGGISLYSNESSEFPLKKTSPRLGGGRLNRDKTSSTYDLIELMQYLYVRVVKAKDNMCFGGGEVVAEVKLGNYRGVTKKVISSSNVEWGQVFAFSKDCIQSSMVEVFVKHGNKDDYLGHVWFDLNEVPRRVPPDSPLAPQWYRMEDKKGDKSKGGEVMMSIWFGTQADEAFSEAWHSKAANMHYEGLYSIKSKGSGMMRFPELFVKVQVGNQIMRTKTAGPNPNRSMINPYWSEELMFVVAEPIEDFLFLSVEDRVGPGREEAVGRVMLPVAAIERRHDDKQVVSRWFNLDNHFGSAVESKLVARFGSKIHLRLSLDGGYHVLDESTMYSSDVRPTAKQLWKPHIGVLEMGILGATGLMPTKLKGQGTKYGQKWVRTRTVVDCFSPKWNEQYTWEVFDPCTVITVGVFDNSRTDKNVCNNAGDRDSRIGKVRVRLSTLESDRVYTHSYPLLMLHTNGVKKMGELHLAPLSVNQLDAMRYQAMNVVASRLSRAELPLGREVVEYMLDHDSHMWSMRRSKANFARLIGVLSVLVAMARWVESMRNWHKPVYSTLFVLAFLLWVAMPELIIPSLFLYMAAVGLWRFRARPRHPPHMDTKLSHVVSVYADELDEEFDSFPTSRSAETVRMRYDRLRSVAGRIQTVVGDMATQGEHFQALLSWRDPRATFLFVVMCLFAAVVFYAVPIRVVAALWGLYMMRPPKFRNK
uniref:C2 domain-containing protein n=1 Tax=Salix viminalis TaxID=40686 RepID=A0A6N2KFA4_SALVM